MTDPIIDIVSLRSTLPPLREGRPADEALIARRGNVQTDDKTLPLLGGVPCLTAEAEGSTATLLHFHGGGYRMGSASAWRGFAEQLAGASGLRVILPDYALAPERPFPAAIHDGIAVLQAIVREGRPVILSGDSAGGGLALAVATLLAAPAPIVGLVLLSPWLDLTVTAGSYARCAESDTLFSHDSALASAADYLQDHSADDAMASPLFADFGTLPPVLLMTGSDEVLCDDALSLAGRLAAARIRTTLIIEPDMPHIWPVLLPDAPASARARSAIAQFAAEVSSPD
jgi:acetyl esterase/lipase